jgi:hypothetical protein
MAQQVEIFNIDFGDTLSSIEKLKAELKETRKLFEAAKPNTPEFTKFSSEVKRLDGTIKTLNAATKENQNALGGINTAAKFAAGSYGELKQKIDQQKKALNELTVGTEEFNQAQEELISLQAQRIEVEKKIPSLFQERIKGALDESNALKQLKADLKAAQSAALNGDGKAAQKVAELKDKIDDLKDSTKSLQGTGVERLNASMGLLTDAFQNLDLDKAKIGFKSLGTAMSAIPLVLLIEGIKALIDNFDAVVKFTKELTGGFNSAEREVISLTKAFEQETFVNKTLIAQYDNQIALLTAQGVSEKELTEIKKKKINVEIIEAENQLRLNSAKVAQILLNDTLGDSLQKLNIALLRKTGQDEAANTLEKTILADKKKRAKEELDTAQAAAISLGKLKNDLLVLDAETNKKQADAAKKTSKEISDERIRIEQERQSREADLINAEIDKEESLKLKYKQLEQKAADDSLDIAKQLIDELNNLDNIRLSDVVSRANTELILEQKTGEQYLELQLNLLDAEKELILNNTELTEAQRLEIITSYDEKERLLRIKSNADKLNAAYNVSSSLTDLSNSLFELDRSNLEKGTAADKAAAKEQFELNKAFSYANALISGALAVVNASATSPYVPLGLSAAISAGISTAAALAKISSTKFQYFDGGFTNRGNPKKEAQSMGNAQFHNNEYVVPDKVLSTPQAKPYVSALEKMRKGQAPSGISGFYDGGFTSRSASSSSFNTAQSQSDLINAVMAMPNPIVKVSEINKVSDSVNVGVSVSNL